MSTNSRIVVVDGIILLYERCNILMKSPGILKDKVVELLCECN
jgi:hypothetical protein